MGLNNSVVIKPKIHGPVTHIHSSAFCDFTENKLANRLSNSHVKVINTEAISKPNSAIAMRFITTAHSLINIVVTFFELLAL